VRVILWCALIACALVTWASSPADAQGGPTAILDRVQVNPRRAIDFHAIVLPDSVYVGQQATYQVAVLLSADARSRLRRNPEFLPPELRGLLAYELGTPTRVAPRSYGGAVFEAHVFQRALFPVTDGRQVVPAPQLTYSMPQSASYFSREERYIVRAESAAFIVKALPVAGRPDDFNGAVGVFTAAVRLDTLTARVGDPLVLTLRVQGTGNVKLLPRPTIELDWASVVPGTERIQVDSSGALVRGTKEFDWILTPSREGRVRVPPLRYSYFDPYAAKYAVAESSPLDVPVERGTLAALDEGEASDVMPLRERGAHDPTPAWSGHGLPPRTWWPWLLLVVLAPLPALWIGRARRASTGSGVVDRSVVHAGAYAEAVADGRTSIRTTRRQLLATLAERFGHTPQTLVSRHAMTRVLRRAGVTRGTTRELIALLDRLDEVGFSALPSGGAPTIDEARLTREVADLLARVEREAMPRGQQVGRSTIGLVSLVLVVLTLGAPTDAVRAQAVPVAPTPQESPRSESAHTADVAAARGAYERRAFGEAAQRFAALAVQTPRDADILVDWGTAAWAAGDTVAAVIAWQRAGRLEPLATDIQRRIDMLPSGARGGVADVPMMPVSWLLRVALAGWCVAWALLAWRAWRVRGRGPSGALVRWTRGVSTLLLIVAASGAAAAWWGLRALDATDLAVVSRPETMRLAPGTDADAMGGVTTGDVVRIVETREGWQRVLHADGRRGWLPVSRLVMMRADWTAPIGL
jgi:hypothetical protein